MLTIAEQVLHDCPNPFYCPLNSNLDYPQSCRLAPLGGGHRLSAQSSGWPRALHSCPIWIPCRWQNHQTEHLADLAGATDRKAHCTLGVR